jgi:hypothetical protein
VGFYSTNGSVEKGHHCFLGKRGKNKEERIKRKE